MRDVSIMPRCQDVQPEYSLVRDFCIPFLVATQNQNGGWGYEVNSESRVEPTCWAVRALLNSPTPVSKDCVKSGIEYLLSSQLKDGSWPAVIGAATGSWVTSLVCSVLSHDADCESSVRAGLRWLCNDYPRDSRLWRRVLGLLRTSEPAVSSHDDSLRGWGWTPRTATWVEPTAFAILALRECPEAWKPGASAHRMELATGVLYDRMCPGGGWNCGNPRVYGVAGEPLVLSTSWALLALRATASHERKTASLSWLAKIFPEIESPASLATARITLEAYGCELPKSRRSLPEMFESRPLGSVQVISWTSLALCPQRRWFPKVGSES